MSLPDYLNPILIEQNAREAGLFLDVTNQLLALAERVANQPAWLARAEAIFAQTYERAAIASDPPDTAIFGGDTDRLYLLLAVDAIRQLRAVHQARGIPAAVTRESFGPLAMCAQRFADWHQGEIGVEDWVLRFWFNVVASGNLYRLGRLEYILKPFAGNVRVYRQRSSGQVQVLLEDGVGVAADGYLPFVFDAPTYAHYGWNQEPAAVGGWTSTLHEDEEQVIGTPVSPNGYAMRSQRQLAKAEWSLVLRNGDTVLDMHIPNYMPLRLDLLRDSLRQAQEFFPRYHPERPFNAFSCSSWMFNTQLAAMLPATSNLLAFQRQGYLFPLPSNGADGIYFIFGNRLIDLATAPQDTQLQRAVIKHLQAGGKLRRGGFLLLPEDVARFGQEPYRGSD